jgi:tetratricopeptide (TPR) repeat protein
MPKLAQLPANDGAPKQGRRRPRTTRRFRRAGRPRHRYYAFLSYSHKDEDLAEWLHRELEGFRVPRALAGRLTENGVVPKRLTPIFRDEQELAAADDLGDEIETALASSQFLIVLCSPNAAKSRWTNTEIETFKRNHPEGCVLAAIAEGEPFASDIPGREDEECFPPALRYRFDGRGRLTNKRAEPLAADLRDGGDDRRSGFLKLVAGMLGVGLDELVQRETARRNRRVRYIVAASLAGMAVTSTLAITAIQARDAARDQRREAEGLIGFMLGDLKDKLEPIGKLDALDGVGSRVLAYYQKQGTSDLTDAALTQRSRALALMGQVANLRGDLGGSERLYREAAAGTEEAVRRTPDDPQRLFEHAQNVFWIGELARRRGDSAGAERSAREYQQLAIKMVAADPNNMKWRIERQNADAELGIVLMDQRRFAEAARQFEGALRTIQAVAAVDPKNSDYQKSIAESFAWLADAEAAQGHARAAIANRRQQIALLQRLMNESDDVQYRQKMIPARQGLGRLLAGTGDLDGAIRELTMGVEQAERLIPAEPDNTLWVEFAAAARIGLAEALLASGKRGEAESHAASACATMGGLLARDNHVQYWRRLFRDCFAVRAEIALRAGNAVAAMPLANRALDVARSTSSVDKVADRFAMARAWRLIGDSRKGLGDAAGARAAWQSAFTVLPSGAPERPQELIERLRLLQRLGRKTEAGELAARLSALGYRGFT